MEWKPPYRYGTMAQMLNLTQEVTAEPPKRGCVSPSGSQTLVSAFSVSAVYRWVNVKLYLEVFFITTDEHFQMRKKNFLKHFLVNCISLGNFPVGT